MPSREELLAEAARRGLDIPSPVDRKQELLAEADKRGISLTDTDLSSQLGDPIRPGDPVFDELRDKGPNPILGLPETALQLATGGAAMIPSGLAGIVTGALNKLPPTILGGEGSAGNILIGKSAAEVVEDVGRELTFEPRSEAGQKLSAGIAQPFESFEQFADIAGEVTGDPDDVLGATMVKTQIRLYRVNLSCQSEGSSTGYLAIDLAE